MLDMRDLYYFQKVAELGHMGKAAEALFLTQPALTKAVQRLEEMIGAPLFARSGRRIKLTALGEMTLEQARHMRQALENSTQRVKDFAGGHAGHIRIGCAPSMARFLLPQLFQKLLATAPDVTIELDIDMSNNLAQKLWEGRLDIIITHLGRPHKHFCVIPISEDVFVAVASQDHPLFNKKYTIHDLASYQWILPSTSIITRRWLNTVFEKHNCPELRVQIQAGPVLYLPRMLENTNLLTMLSRRNIKIPQDGVTLREVALQETTLHRVFSFAYKESNYHAPAVMKLIELLMEIGPVLFEAERDT